MIKPHSTQPNPLESVLKAFTDEIYSSLKDFANTNQLTGKFVGGVMPGSDSGSGSIFYLPNADPNEEGIGAEWDVTRSSESSQGVVSIWLGWTHGDVLKDYCDRKSFSWKTNDDRARELRTILWSFKDEIIIDLQKEIVVPRLPYYRKDR